jgi:predicted patatin/cPLA2 family phospholipase
VKPAFLNKLFEYRLFYQDTASQTTGKAKSLHSTLVTWVDVLLASLSVATIAVAAAASEVQLLDQGVSETIRRQKRHDSIRAATQLPGKALSLTKIWLMSYMRR